MNLFFIMNVRFPTEKAHGWQIAKMAEAVLKSGRQMTLVLPARKNDITQDAETYYGLSTKIPTIRLPVIDLLGSKWIPRSIAFALFEWTFLRSLRRWSRTVKGESVAITRDHFFAARFRKPDWTIACELHDVGADFFAAHRRLGSNAQRFIVTNAWKRDQIAKVWGPDAADRTLVAPNGIDLAPYANMPTREDARAKLGWNPTEHIAVYTGHLYGWKGVDTLAKASALLPPDWRIVFVGGTTSDQAAFHARVASSGLDRITLIPHVSHADVLTYLAAADVLVLPNSGVGDYATTTSPIKLWEYLAARRPVVASDIPAIRELVTESEVVFVVPDDSAALAKGIVDARMHSENRIEAGWRCVAERSWTARVDAILRTIV